MAVELRPVPPREAIRAFEARGLRLHSSFAWQEVYAGEHAAMFTVAKSAGFDILQEIYDELLVALSEGKTFRQFADELTPLLQRKGWWGRQQVINPLTGFPEEAQLGSPRRLRTIFDANMRVSYASGHWANFLRNKRLRPYLRYIAVDDQRTRPHHFALHNLTLPVDHDFWDIFAPPNGWNCRCTLQSLSLRDVDRMREQLVFEPPAIDYRMWTNKVTGEERAVPVGVDSGWDYNPGRAGHDATLAKLAGRQRSLLDGR